MPERGRMMVDSIKEKRIAIKKKELKRKKKETKKKKEKIEHQRCE